MKNASVAVLIALLVTFGQASSAHAHPDDADAVRATLLAADALAIGAGVTVALAQPFYSADDIGRLGRGTATTLGIGLLAGPTIHWAYGHGIHGGLSAGLRALLPLLTGSFALIGLCMPNTAAEDCARKGMAYGTAVGTIVAAGADALLITSLSQKSVDDPTQWYGWQTLLVDASGAGFGLFMFANANEHGVSDDGLITFPMTQWLGIWLIGTLGAPIVHMVNGEWVSGGVSLVLRALASPALSLGGMTAYCAALAGEDGCVGAGFSWGLMGGALFVAALDALVLARKDVEEEPAPTSSYVGPAMVGDAPGVIIGATF